MNEYINSNLEEMMYILLDRISRIKNIDFEKVNKAKIASIIKKISYDTLVTFYYVYDGETEQIKNFLKNDLGIGLKWTILENQVLITTPDGIDITLTVDEPTTLAGLKGTISATTNAIELIKAEESEKNTQLSVIDGSQKVTYKNGRAWIENDDEKQPIKEKISGLNTLINYSRNGSTMQATIKK